MNLSGYIDVGGESKLMELELKECQQEVKRLRALSAAPAQEQARLARERLLKFKTRNNQRRDEDKPELREAVDDIYKLLGFLETGRVGRLEAQLQGVMNCLAESQKEVEALRSAPQGDSKEVE